MTRSFLDEMAEGSRERVRAARRERSEAALERETRHAPAPPALRLDPRGFDLIAEFKLRSPAAGRLGAAAQSVGARVTEYAHAGAAAVSVLTEPTRFDGSLEHLASAAAALAPLGVPVMRKDFLVDPYQVLEARAAGAGGVLAIVRMLSRAGLEALLDCARAQGARARAPAQARAAARTRRTRTRSHRPAPRAPRPRRPRSSCRRS